MTKLLTIIALLWFNSSELGASEGEKLGEKLCIKQLDSSYKTHKAKIESKIYQVKLEGKVKSKCKVKFTAKDKFKWVKVKKKGEDGYKKVNTGNKYPKSKDILKRSEGYCLLALPGSTVKKSKHYATIFKYTLVKGKSEVKCKAEIKADGEVRSIKIKKDSDSDYIKVPSGH